ncbi:hypothetical protein I2494_17995 [Budviciaceae bacterium BWR-B9]|uniref:Uncharacterized protein n=2 Tax=Budviciaceae TaxID=1903416 RepID=A0ABS1IUY5_9GAMM|nr:hypothetical protein [Limnobaculum allomyrinae]MBV7693692.1 hypothetical protein [Limnobaculum sp. M2-1]
MGVSKPLTIAGRHFSTTTAAKKYFMDKRTEVKSSGPTTEGELFSELYELYTRYCDLSPGWGLNGREIIAFSVDYELRKNRDYAQHLCFRVHFSNKEIRPFSIPNALTTLANASV